MPSLSRSSVSRQWRAMSGSSESARQSRSAHKRTSPSLATTCKFRERVPILAGQRLPEPLQCLSFTQSPRRRAPINTQSALGSWQALCRQSSTAATRAVPASRNCPAPTCGRAGPIPCCQQQEASVSLGRVATQGLQDRVVRYVSRHRGRTRRLSTPAPTCPPQHRYASTAQSRRKEQHGHHATRSIPPRPTRRMRNEASPARAGWQHGFGPKIGECQEHVALLLEPRTPASDWHNGDGAS